MGRLVEPKVFSQESFQLPLGWSRWQEGRISANCQGRVYRGDKGGCLNVGHAQPLRVVTSELRELEGRSRKGLPLPNALSIGAVAITQVDPRRFHPRRPQSALAGSQGTYSIQSNRGDCGALRSSLSALDFGDDNFLVRTRYRRREINVEAVAGF
jgi:hypothetical protein